MNEQKLKELYWELRERAAMFYSQIEVLEKEGVDITKLNAQREEISLALAILAERAKKKNIDLNDSSGLSIVDNESDDWEQIINSCQFEPRVKAEIVHIIKNKVKITKPKNSIVLELIFNAEKYYVNGLDRAKNGDILIVNNSNEPTPEDRANYAKAITAALLDTLQAMQSYKWEGLVAHENFKAYYHNKKEYSLSETILSAIDQQLTFASHQFKLDLVSYIPAEYNDEKKYIKLSKTKFQAYISGSFTRTSTSLTISGESEIEGEVLKFFAGFMKKTIGIGSVSNFIKSAFQKEMIADAGKGKLTSSLFTTGVRWDLGAGRSVLAQIDLISINWTEMLFPKEGDSKRKSISIGGFRLKGEVDLLKLIAKESSGAVFQKASATISLAWDIVLNEEILAKIGLEILKKKAEGEAVENTVDAALKKAEKLSNTKKYKKVQELSKVIENNIPDAAEGVKDALSGKKPSDRSKKAVDAMKAAVEEADKLIDTISGGLKDKADDVLKKSLGYADDIFRGALRMVSTPAGKGIIKTAAKFIPIVGQIFAVFDAVVTVIQVVKFAYDNWDEIKKIFSSNEGVFEPINGDINMPIDETRVKPIVIITPIDK